MTPPPKPLSPHLPPNWNGGTFGGHLEPLTPDWYAEEHTDLERVLEMGDWGPIEAMVEADPPGRWGFEPGGVGGAGAGPRRTETRSGAVLRRSLSGLVLDDFPDQWLNVSRFGPPVDLGEAHTGDIAIAEVELGGDGRAYLRSLRVLPLDGFDPPEPAGAQGGGEEPGA